MKTLLTLLTPLAAGIALSAAPATAQAGHGDWFRGYRPSGPSRHQTERRLRELREHDKDRLDNRFDALEDQLKHWYEREKDLLKARYDRQKHFHHGTDRARFTQRYHASRAELRRQYREKKERLDDREDILEDQIEHRYDRQKRGLEHQRHGRSDSFWYEGRHGAARPDGRTYQFGSPSWYGGSGLPGAILPGYGQTCPHRGARDRHHDRRHDDWRDDRDPRIGLSIGLPRGGGFSVEF